MVFNKRPIDWFPYVPDFCENREDDQPLKMEMKKITGSRQLGVASQVQAGSGDIFRWRDRTFRGDIVRKNSGKYEARTDRGGDILNMNVEALHTLRLFVDHIQNIENCIPYEGEEPITDVVDFAFFSMDQYETSEEKMITDPDGNLVFPSLFAIIIAALRQSGSLSGDALENFIEDCDGSETESEEP